MPDREEPVSDPPSGKAQDELELEPVAAESSDRILQRLEAAEHEPEEVEDPAEPGGEKSFTLQQLLALVLVVSVLLAMLRLLSPPLAAGVVGLIVLVGMVLMSLHDSYPAIVQLLWWLLLVLYLAMSVMAVLMQSS